MLATLCLAPFVFFGALSEKAKGVRAVADAQVITLAVKTYYLQNNRWPVQTFDVAPFLEKGKDGLLDPWGEPYKYALSLDEKGNTIPHVWAEREVKGELKVFGNKPKEKK